MIYLIKNINMNLFKERFSSLKFRAYILYCLCFLTGINIMTMVLSGNLDSIWLNSVEFLLLILMNRILYGFATNKKVLKIFLLFSESCFLLYIIFLFVYKEKHFIAYRSLELPATIYFISQLFNCNYKKI